MPNDVSVSADKQYESLPLLVWLAAQADAVLRSEAIDGAVVSVMLTDDETVQALNRDFRGFDQPTDVLSFGLSDMAKPATDDQEPEEVDFILPPDAGRQLGEVVIAFPTGERQAKEHGCTLEMEIAHLLIHGVLHLLGYDHYEPDEERQMRAREENLLAERLWERSDTRWRPQSL